MPCPTRQSPSRQSSVASNNPKRAWAGEYGVTDAEYEVLELIERGLTKQEVCKASWPLSNTARNRIAALFRKQRVSTHSELAFVVSNLSQRQSRDARSSHPLEELLKATSSD